MGSEEGASGRRVLSSPSGLRERARVGSWFSALGVERGRGFMRGGAEREKLFAEQSLYYIHSLNPFIQSPMACQPVPLELIMALHPPEHLILLTATHFQSLPVACHPLPLDLFSWLCLLLRV